MRRVSKTWFMRPDRLDTGTPEQVQPFGVWRIGQQDREMNRRLRESGGSRTVGLLPAVADSGSSEFFASTSACRSSTQASE